jgi:hypothetical protein
MIWGSGAATGPHLRRRRTAARVVAAGCGLRTDCNRLSRGHDAPGREPCINRNGCGRPAPALAHFWMTLHFSRPRDTGRDQLPRQIALATSTQRNVNGSPPETSSADGLRPVAPRRASERRRDRGSRTSASVTGDEGLASQPGHPGQPRTFQRNKLHHGQGQGGESAGGWAVSGYYVSASQKAQVYQPRWRDRRIGRDAGLGANSCQTVSWWLMQQRRLVIKIVEDQQLLVGGQEVK